MDKTLTYSRFFEHLLGEDEILMWTAKPSPIGVLDLSRNYIFICAALMLAFCFIPNFMDQQNYYLSLPLFFSFLGVLTLPVLLFKFIEFKGTYFAYTSKRIIIRSKFLHEELSSYYYNNVETCEWQSSFFEKRIHCGSIKLVFFFGEYDSEHEKLIKIVKLMAIENAPEVYAKLKTQIAAYMTYFMEEKLSRMIKYSDPNLEKALDILELGKENAENKWNVIENTLKWENTKYLSCEVCGYISVPKHSTTCNNCQSKTWSATKHKNAYPSKEAWLKQKQLKWYSHKRSEMYLPTVETDTVYKKDEKWKCMVSDEDFDNYTKATTNKNQEGGNV